MYTVPYVQYRTGLWYIVVPVVVTVNVRVVRAGKRENMCVWWRMRVCGGEREYM